LNDLNFVQITSEIADVAEEEPAEADTFADIDAESDAEMRTGVFDSRLMPSPNSTTKKPDPPPQR